MEATRVASSDDGLLSRDEYFAERRMLIDARQRCYQRAEQMVTGGATGALVLSITFLEKLAPGVSAREPGVLVSGWVLLLASLAIGLTAHYLSAQAFDCEIRCLEASLHRETIPQNSWSTWNRRANGVSAVLFVVGIALLARFAFVNAPFHP